MDLIAEATVAGVIIGGFTAFGNVWSSVTQRLIDRRHVTLDMLREIEANPDIIAARRKFLLLTQAGSLALYAEKKYEGTDEFYSIVTVLNQFELISIGIQRGIIDPKLFERINKSSVLMYWTHAAPFVLALRAKFANNRLYNELENMTFWLENRKPPPRPRLRDLFF